jgi:hypothetical protein
MAHYVNSQKSSKIVASVTNKATATASRRKVTSNEIINSQIESDIEGDVTNTFVSDLGNRGHKDNLLMKVWKAIPGLNAAMLIYDKLFHLFRH